MKIALVTIHKANNYGAVLQAFATNKILSRFGEVKTVNYESRHLSKQLNYFRFAPSVHGGMMLIHDVLRSPYRFNILYKFKKFIQTHMNLTEELSVDELMQNKAGDFDIYVCGSDQIWNPRIVGQIDPVFFLTFAPKEAKKISLSSSIGSYIFSDKERKKLVRILEDFDAISLREDDGQKQLSGILPNKKIHHTLDPTLLFSKDEWLDFMDLKQVRSRKKYLLVYSVPRAKLIKEAVNFFSKKFRLQVILIDQGLFSSVKSDNHIRNAGPRDFVELFINAEFIVTDSFHGTCFAVNLGKRFIAIAPGASSNRIESLLRKLEIEERIVSTSYEFGRKCFSNDLDLDLKRKLSIMREKSLAFIEKAVAV